MLVIRDSHIKYYQFDIFCDQDLVHGIFTRQGGVSLSPWKSLNLGGTVGDLRENVIENRRRIFGVMQREVETLFDVWQVHSDTVIVTDRPRRLDSPQLQGDAIITSNPDVTLFMRFADCVPILFFDPVVKVVAIAHAGWKGTVNKIAARTIERMCDLFGSNVKDIRVGIGPSIGPDHYEIKADVIGIVRENLNGMRERVLIEKQGKIHLDLWNANREIVESTGVTQVEIAHICTACEVGDWYSHRAEHGKTGRFGALIALRRACCDG